MGGRHGRVAPRRTGLLREHRRQRQPVAGAGSTSLLGAPAARRLSGRDLDEASEYFDALRAVSDLVIGWEFRLPDRLSLERWLASR
jgi:hypothetical protein